MTIYEEALRLVHSGLSVIPIRADGTKRPWVDAMPNHEWGYLQERPPTDSEVRAWWANGEPKGIALIAGAVSGNAELIDFDDTALVDLWLPWVRDAAPGLIERLAVVRTPRPGFGVWYRCEAPVPGNQKLALGWRDEVDATTGEITKKKKALIETRGEGGYALIPPSPPECHPTHREYLLRRGDLGALPVITAEERSILIGVARALSEIVEEERAPRPAPRSSSEPAGERPGDDYNQRGDFRALLEAHGWRLNHQRGEGSYWRRPGKDRGVSASLDAVAPGILNVFSSNAYPLEDRAYDLFGAYVTLVHRGDFTAATRALRDQGYGKERARPLSAVAVPAAAKNGPEPAAIHETDVGNARRLAREYGRDLRFTKSHGWLCFDGKRWRRDLTGQAKEWAKATIASMYREAADLPEAERKSLVGWALKSEARPRVEAMLSLAESEPAIAALATAFDQDRLLLNVENGTIDLTTGALRPHDRTELITRLAPVDYDPRARAPQFFGFLEAVLGGDRRLMRFVQRIAGYSLTGLVNEQCLFFLYGIGANGKSTLLNLLLALLGDYAGPAAPGLLLERQGEQHPTQIADLYGRRLVVVTEIGEGKRLAEELVKQITGGDRLKGRYMNRDFFDFEPEFKLWLAANHRPLIRGTDHAIWRRIPIVPFEAVFADQPGPGEQQKDPELAERLRGELPGILAWAVRGGLAWQRVGLKRPDKVEHATAAYRAEMDNVGDFLLDCCQLDPTFRARAGDLYEAYRQWAERNGEAPMRQIAFGQRLQERGFTQERTITARFWRGLGLKQESGPESGGALRGSW